MTPHTFSDEEALRIATEIERKGERFYRMAQGLARDQALINLLEMLRQQEQAHAARFAGMLEELQARRDEEEDPYQEETNAFLSAIAAEVVFPGGVMASMMDRKIDTVRDLLLYAVSTEKDSILFYMELARSTRVKENVPVFEQIIAEEKRHLYDLQRLLEETEA